ncbi:hypothetical protein E4U42_005166 [Claviceps africana]|uniref:CFEM domain-containing protein n=1 Tax=Claviceps africana TaxID=83212 RepID=A0A8K0J442_9HYPO|nr:hypothetical protein E4U42_005166 [Claviceps africana]
MKSVLITLALATGLVAAQSASPQLDKIPKCAYNCVSSYITGSNIAGCAPADIACVCSNKDFLSGISCCLEKDCGKDDIQSTIQFAAGICNASGVKTPSTLVCNKNSGGSGPATTSTSSAPVPSTTSAAAPVYANVGGVLGAVVAVVALL